MRAIIVGAGMGGLFAALALRESGVFKSINVYEQTKTPATAGAGFNVSPNGARLCKWLGIDLDGGDPKGLVGVLDGGRAAILESTRGIEADGSVSVWPMDHNTSANDGAGFHHMHRLDMLMCLHKRVAETILDARSGLCQIHVHMGKRLQSIRQDDASVIAIFEDGSTAEGELLVGADGINSRVLTQMHQRIPEPRWTEVICYRGLIPRAKVAALKKADGSPMNHNPIDSFSMDSLKLDRAWVVTYWVRGGELLNVWMAYYEPNSEEFETDEGDWFPADPKEYMEKMGEAFKGDVRRDDVLAMAGAVENPTKWGLYDRDAVEHWIEGRICLLGDAAHPMLPTFGQGVNQAFEDGAALSKCFELHGTDYQTALLHYERVRYYRANRFAMASKFAFPHLEPKDTPERRAILKAADERDYPLFDHAERAGGDMNWIYGYDAREIGDKVPTKRLGPWDFRPRKLTLAARKKVAQNLWVPPVDSKGDRQLTRAEVARHNTFEDCWIIIKNKVYDFSEWKDHHPGGPYVARMYAGRDATAEFGDFHSQLAQKHMAHFCVGDLVETERTSA